MGQVFDAIDDGMRTWIEQQHLFFVGTAPDQMDGHLNISPKGSDCFRVLGPNRVVYLDLVGSGIETVAHLKQNGRIVVMFCAFDGAPRVVRLHGRGAVIEPGDSRFNPFLERFNPGDDYRSLLRSFITIEIERVSTSCGFVVPRMEFVADRDQLPKWAANKQQAFGDAWKTDYLIANNRQSIDGIPALDLEPADAELVARQSSVGKAL